MLKKSLSVEVLVVGGLMLVAALVLAQRAQSEFIDDALITMRYASNIASGEGWTYNVGETTANGATSPAVTLVTAALTVPLQATERATNLLFVASYVAIGVFLVLAFRRCQAPWVALVASIAVLLNPLIFATKGMETLPFLALICAVLWASTTERDAVFGVLCGAMVLTRGEGLLLVGAVFATRWLIQRRLPIRPALWAGATLTPWAVYSLITFNSVFPDTMSAKEAQTASGYWGEGYLFFRAFFDLAPAFEYRTWLLIATPFLALGLVRSVIDARVRPVAGPLVVATTLHALAYGLVLGVPGYHWYYGWEMFTLAVLTGLGGGWIIEYLPRPAVSQVVAAGALSVVALVGVTRLGTPIAGPQQYVDIGNWLQANTRPTDRIAATEIGAIGWHSQRPIVDYLGLLSTDSIEELRKGDLVSWLEREEPDYWVVHNPLWGYESPAASQPWFALAYDGVMETEGPDFQRLIVYKRTRPIADAKALVPTLQAP